MKLDIFLAFVRHPIKFPVSLFKAVRWARAYEKTVGKKFKEM